MLHRELKLASELDAQQLKRSTVGLVSLSGAYQGGVILHISENLLFAAANHMFDIPLSELNDSQIMDTAAELTNMVGGSIKGTFPQPTKLELPKVFEPGQVIPDLQRSQLTLEVGFNSKDGELVVTVYQDKAE